MANFVNLSGVRLPCSAVSASNTDANIVGTIERSYRGRIADSRRLGRRTWAVKTPIKEWHESEAIAALASGQGFGVSFREGLNCERNGHRPQPGMVTQVEMRPQNSGVTTDGVARLHHNAVLAYDFQLHNQYWTIGWWEFVGSAWQWRCLDYAGTGFIAGTVTAGVGTTAGFLEVSVDGGVVKLTVDKSGSYVDICSLFAFPHIMPTSWMEDIDSTENDYFPMPGLVISGEIDNLPFEATVDGEVDDEAWVQAAKNTTVEAQAEWLNNHRELSLRFGETDSRWVQPS